MPSVERLRELLNYDPKTGVFTWRVDRRNGNVIRKKAGDVAGCKRGKTGYEIIGIDGKLYLAHRLAWQHVFGVKPSRQVDHINGDRSDNSLDNLRLASQSQQNGNQKRRRDNTSGLRGVHKHKNKWKTQIGRKHIGVFDTKQDAYAAYEDEARRYYGEFYNDRSR